MIQGFKNLLFIAVVTSMVVNCAPRKRVRQTFQGALGYCGNSKLGDFDVVLNPAKNNPGLFELKVAVVNVANPGGSYVRMALVNERSEFQELVQYALIKPNKILYQGLVTSDQIAYYPLVAVVPWKGQTASTFLEEDSDDDEAICSIPTTDTLSGTTAYGVIQNAD